MEILELADRVERGDFESDRRVVTSDLTVNGETVTFTYTMTDAMQHAQTMLTQRGATA